MGGGIGMAVFRDRVLLELSDAARIGALVLPAGDDQGRHVRTMLAATYDLSAVRIDQVRGVTARTVSAQRPLAPVSRRSGVWTQTVPSYTRTDVTLDVPAPTEPVWIDLLVEWDVTVVAEVDLGGVESVVSKAFDDFTTLDEFRARFAFLDLDRFMAEHHVRTVEELRAVFDYVVTEVRLRQRSTFDPADPANTHTVAVTLAAVVVDPFDLAEGLRAARLVQDAARSLTGAAAQSIPAESVAAYAPAAVFAGAGLDDGRKRAVEQLFAREGVVSLFLNANEGV
jgi:hypothetical protein